MALGLDDGIWADVVRTDCDGPHGVIMVLGVLGALVRVLESNDQFSIGSSLTLRFRLPGSQDHIRCGCIVRSHLPKYDIGVEFILIQATHRARLAEAIGSLRLVAAA